MIDNFIDTFVQQQMKVEVKHKYMKDRITKN